MIVRLDFQTGFEIVIQGQPFADIGHRNLVASGMLGLTDGRIGDGDAQLLSALIDGNVHRTAFRRRLDAVIDRVFEQRLQHQRRNRQIQRNCADFPVDRKTFAEPERFEFEILFAQRDFVGQADQLSRIAHGGAKEIGQRLERLFGLLWPGTDQ